jgi:hypothetical protein
MSLWCFLLYKMEIMLISYLVLNISFYLTNNNRNIIYLGEVI